MFLLDPQSPQMHKMIAYCTENITTLLILTPGVDSPIRNSGRYGDVNPGLEGLAGLPTGEPSAIGSISTKLTRNTKVTNENKLLPGCVSLYGKDMIFSTFFFNLGQ